MSHKFLTPNEQARLSRNEQWVKAYKKLKAEYPDVRDSRLLASMADEYKVSLSTIRRAVTNQ